MQDGKEERKRLPLCIRLFVRVSRPMQEIRNANRLPADPRQFLHVYIILASSETPCTHPAGTDREGCQRELLQSCPKDFGFVSRRYHNHKTSPKVSGLASFTQPPLL